MADSSELDRLAGARGSWPKAAASSELHGWIEMLTERGGSDLFLVAGRPPAIRLDDNIEPLGTVPLDEHDIEAAVLQALPDHVAQRYRAHGIADTSLTRADSVDSG